MRGGVDTTQVMTETVEDKVSHSITGLDILKGIAAVGAVISGTVATQTKVFTNESAVLEKTVEKTDALATNGTVVLGTISTSNSASSTSLSAQSRQVHLHLSQPQPALRPQRVQVHQNQQVHRLRQVFLHHLLW